MQWLENAYGRLFSNSWREMLAFFLLSGLVYALFWGIGIKLVKRLREKKRREMPQREIEFTLPDRENAYVRARLSTVLNGELNASEEREEELSVGFAYAQKLLAKICLAPLSPAERLEVGDLQIALENYVQKSGFNSAEMQRLNELFSRLLKLSAKYAV